MEIILVLLHRVIVSFKRIMFMKLFCKLSLIWMWHISIFIVIIWAKWKARSRKVKNVKKNKWWEGQKRVIGQQQGKNEAFVYFCLRTGRLWAWLKIQGKNLRQSRGDRGSRAHGKQRPWSLDKKIETSSSKIGRRISRWGQVRMKMA